MASHRLHEGELVATNCELELVWDGGSLDLMGENDTDYGPVLFEALADGTEWGNPQSVRRALFSLLADGSASVTDRHDNRTAVVKLRLTAADSAALAGGEAPLHLLASKRRAELRWTPPNDFAAPAVFTIVASDLAHSMDDLNELRCVRMYTLTLACLPFARSLDPVVVEALPPFVAAPDVLDDCTSTAGWASLFGGATFTVGSGGVEVTAFYNDGLSINATLTKPLARTKRYLAIEAELVTGSHFYGGTFRPTIRTDSGWMPGNPEVVGAEGKWTFYDVPDSLGAIQEIRFGFYPMDADGAYTIARILTIAESDAPAITAGHQSLRFLDIPGSAPAAGTLHIAARGVETLGEVVVYTMPAEYDPRLSVGRAESDTLTSAALSGATADSRTSFTFYRLAQHLPPGPYVLWANPLPDGAPGDLTVTWTITTRLVFISTGFVVEDLDSFTTTTTHTAAAFGKLQPMATLDLPGIDLPVGSPYHIEFVLTSSVAVTWDEGLLFNRLGELTVVDIGTSSSKLWLDSAALDHAPRVLRGSGGKADAVPVFRAGVLKAWDGSHRLPPGVSGIFVASTGGIEVEVSGELDIYWHTHPAS